MKAASAQVPVEKTLSKPEMMVGQRGMTMMDAAGKRGTLSSRDRLPQLFAIFIGTTPISSRKLDGERALAVEAVNEGGEF